MSNFLDNVLSNDTIIYNDNSDKIINLKDNELIENEISNINFIPIHSSENYAGNYDNYVAMTLSEISHLKKVNFENILNNPSLYKYYPNEEISLLKNSTKKILLLDLDETLIHADFNNEYVNNTTIKYDKIISFEDENEIISVGIFIRNGLNIFLKELSKDFTIGIFTASYKNYADAIIDYIDPNKNYIKFRLYRDNCIQFNNISIKDLRILKGIDLKNVVLVDNSMYSFANQLNNGILINSFYFDKNDVDLFSVMNYLKCYVNNADDIREVNKEFFSFEEFLKQLTEERLMINQVLS
jgi:Dullard-like phosphatase family protein